jgi:hypothetical protein
MLTVWSWAQRLRLLALVALLAIPMGLAIWWWPVRTYYGYCHPMGRYVTDAEKVDELVSAVLATYPPPIPVYRTENGHKRVVDVQRPRDPVPYASTEEFLRLNPNCCFITDRTRKGPNATFLSRVTGSISAIVVADYLVRYRGEDGSIVAVPYGRANAVDNCGRLWSGY